MSNFADGNFDTRYGVIKVRNPGSFSARDNFRTYRQDGGGTVILQEPAMRAFKAAEVKATPRRMRRKGKVLPIRITGVGYRSYDSQADLYYGPDNIGGRYADPDGSLHVEAIAVDIDMNQSYLRRRRIKRALESEGWHYGVSGEPWHASFRLSG